MHRVWVLGLRVLTGRLSLILGPIVVAVALFASGWFTLAGIRASNAHHQVAHGAASVRAELNYLAALEAGVAAGRPMRAADTEMVDAGLDRYLPMALAGLSSDTADRLRREVEDYRATAIAAADTPGTGAVAPPQPPATFERLAAEFASLEQQGMSEADRANTEAMRGLTLSSLAAGLVIFGVVVAESRSRSRRSLRRARAEVAERYRGLIENTPDHIYVVEEGGAIDFASPSAVAALGGSPRHVDQLLALLPPESREAAREAMIVRPEALTEPLLAPIEATGQWYEVTVTDQRTNPVINGVVLTTRDVTDRVELQEMLRRQAQEDDLTGLPNRRALQEAMERARRRAIDGSRTPALLVIDLDGFKGINDTLGHPFGDRLLTMAGERLVGLTRAGETMARLGGDEFALMAELSEGDPLEQAERAAARLLDAIRVPYELEGHHLVVEASIGVALGGESTDPDTLLRHADIALYEAKQAGGSRWRVFAQEMEDVLVRDERLRRELDGALDDGQLSLVYQPLVSVADGGIVGFEALMRWASPDLGVVSPGSFIPVAERSGAICHLGRWALREAVGQLGEWQERFGLDRLTMSVNASIVELMEGGYVEHLAELLDRSGLDPSTLQIEVTESVLADDLAVVIDRLASIRALGVRVALDDFGTGYSSMSQLQALPVDCLKIDRAFIATIGDDERSTSVVRALVELGRALGLVTVAEGIETTEQLDALRDADCDLAQGFLLARPMPAAEVADCLPSSCLPSSCLPSSCDEPTPAESLGPTPVI